MKIRWTVFCSYLKTVKHFCNGSLQPSEKQVPKTIMPWRSLEVSVQDLIFLSDCVRFVSQLGARNFFSSAPNHLFDWYHDAFRGGGSSVQGCWVKLGTSSSAKVKHWLELHLFAPPYAFVATILPSHSSLSGHNGWSDLLNIWVVCGCYIRLIIMIIVISSSSSWSS